MYNVLISIYKVSSPWAKLTQKIAEFFKGSLHCWTQERHKALEEMGISVQSSGIAVEKSKFYLVNLNADPSMNELLVYYLKVIKGTYQQIRMVVMPFSMDTIRSLQECCN